MPAPRQIIQIGVVVIGLPLETYPMICPESIALGLNEPPEPFSHIEQIETEISELAHLLRVYSFMIKHPVGYRHVAFYKQYAEKVDGSIPLTYRQQFVSNHFHDLSLYSAKLTKSNYCCNKYTLFTKIFYPTGLEAVGKSMLECHGF